MVLLILNSKVPENNVPKLKLRLLNCELLQKKYERHFLVSSLNQLL